MWLTASAREEERAGSTGRSLLISAIGRFVGDAPQFDDTTMLCIKLKRTAEEEPRETES
jgi:hypothetical protein